MKKLVLLCVFVLSLGSLLSSCLNKDEEITSEARITAFINGIPWSAVLAAGFHTDDVISFTASGDGGQTLVISFKAEVGTQVLSALGDSTMTDVIPSISYSNTSFGSISHLSQACGSSSGSEIVITSIDENNKTVSGTFKARLCGTNSSIQITRGEFKAARYN